ncbi:MAG: hypothetical protein J6C42_07295 [Clostridia bacterium]|nr:hypothetical protein [Oscillospiraceae bacterium]MBO5257281.1 hypothetical protein [Clostridia bacterium]
MKNILMKIALVIVLLMCAAALASCGNSDDPYAPPAGMVSATDNKADFCLYVPDEWQIDYTTAAAGAYYSASDPSSVSVLAWDLDYTDTTVEEWWETNVNEVGIVFDEINVESEENITLSDVYGKKYVYTASLGDFQYKIMQAACIKGSSVYLFTYTAVPENYDLHTEDVAAMLEHFIIK